jgi:hypothetical protein
VTIDCGGFYQLRIRPALRQRRVHHRHGSVQIVVGIFDDENAENRPDDHEDNGAHGHLHCTFPV